MDEAKRVIIEHYPVERLPDDVREQFSGEAEVILTVETRAPRPATPRRTISEILDSMQEERVLNGDPAERIRALRAGSDRREELHARIRRGETL